MNIKAFCLSLGLLLTANIYGQQTKQQFVTGLNYYLYLPDDYNNDTTKKWPVMISLHGAGLRGNDIEKITTVGPQKLISEGQKYPFIVISPQCPPDQSWSADLIIMLLRENEKNLRIDPDRVYLTGWSMGGMGTWAIAMRYPDVFAAIAPIAGAGNSEETWTLRHMPTWIFHGEKDKLVNVKNARIMYQALLPFGNVRITIYPDAGHDSWTKTYNNPELYKWFLTNKRFKFEEGQMPTNPERFTGTYISGTIGPGLLPDSAFISLKDGKLFFKESGSRSGEQQIFPSKNNSFFSGKTNNAEIIYNGAPGDRYNSFTYYRQSFTSSNASTFKRIK